MNLHDIITDAVSVSSTNAGVRTTAAKLAEAWIEYGYGTADEPGRFRHLEIIGTEVPFWVRLGETVYAAGYADTLFRETTTGTVFVQEIKTTKSDKWYGESDWLKEIKRSAQPAIEALATVAGRWGATGMTIGDSGATGGACVQVAALTKTSAPDLWPKDPKDGVLVYTPDTLAACRAMLLATAAAIFKLRKQAGPWQWTGRQCIVFEGGGKKRDCEFMEPFCAAHAVAEKVTVEDGRSSDLRRLIERVEGMTAGQLDDPGYVVLSKSSIELLHGCWEKYRIGKELGHRGPSSTAMEIGSATHAAIGALHDAMVRKDMVV